MCVDDFHACPFGVRLKMPLFYHKSNGCTSYAAGIVRNHQAICRVSFLFDKLGHLHGRMVHEIDRDISDSIQFLPQSDGLPASFTPSSLVVQIRQCHPPAATIPNICPPLRSRPPTSRFRPHHNLDFSPAMWYPSRRFCHQGLPALRKGRQRFRKGQGK